MKKIVILMIVVSMLTFSACSGGGNSGGTVATQAPTQTVDIFSESGNEMFMGDFPDSFDYPYEYEQNNLDDNYLNFYQVLVGTFCDSNGDGIGDLNGLTSKLDYISDLGFNGIWMLPIHNSYSYHKYDVLDYLSVDPSYGTMADFENLAEQCQAHGIKLIMDMVFNHTASGHPWFTASKNAMLQNTQSKYKDYYNYSTTYESNYHKLSNNLYFEGVFYDGMPDLNVSNPAVVQELKDICKFWLEKGAGGFRFDAAKHIFDDTDKNVEFFKDLNSYCKTIDPDYYAVSEVWSDGATIKQYHTAEMSSFNYVFGGSNTALYLKSAKGLSDADKYVSSLLNWNSQLNELNCGAMDSPFLTNHDNDRSANMLNKNIACIKFAANLYLMSPGSTFTYYGEEIGMISNPSSEGSSKDPDRRAPMYWSDTASKCTAIPSGGTDFSQYYPSAEIQARFDGSIMSTYKRALEIRNAFPEIARGKLSAITLDEEYAKMIGGYKSTYNGQSVVIIHNFELSPVEITLDKSSIGYENVVGYLTSTGEQFSINDQKIIFPALSTIILK